MTIKEGDWVKVVGQSNIVISKVTRGGYNGDLYALSTTCKSQEIEYLRRYYTVTVVPRPEEFAPAEPAMRGTIVHAKTPDTFYTDQVIEAEFQRLDRPDRPWHAYVGKDVFRNWDELEVI